MLTTLLEFLRDNPDPTEREVRIAISGNLCRCTGYQNIVRAVLRAAELAREDPAIPGGRPPQTPSGGIDPPAPPLDPPPGGNPSPQAPQAPLGGAAP